ncbi:pirin family protein [Thermoflavimicrobium dichotomicum]|uniref:Pirin N-terminal domain-containing protein n=1 Tax=Thermoflavimicrobium dichotomicum TaxID=46223 RepID=A0A1I3SXB2_9BACL|nr:pirin family protein [Thermoflavimicrobium dichotomicum]SFJ62191.1 hypothetical protein SAMN05421852_11453 [Thermoflavimicrobium dichotomicum]
MIRIYPANSRYKADHGWLTSHFSFSFAEYFDPNNMSFGPLRVLNDDIVQPGHGFPPHPHQEMEIVSIVLKGQLKHEDSIGNAEILQFGQVQRMTAGTGIIHSEMNPSATDEVNLLQLWFLPNQAKLSPSYETVSYDPQKMNNALLPVVSNKVQSEHVAYIHQDLTLYLSKLEAKKEISFQQAPGRRIFLFVIEGDLMIHGETQLHTRDSARITEQDQLDLTTHSGATFMLIDLP